MLQIEPHDYIKRSAARIALYLGFATALLGCGLLPFDRAARSYPVIGSGVDDRIIIELSYTNGRSIRGPFYGNARWNRENEVTDNIRVLNSDSMQIAFYPRDYLDKKRSISQTKNEFWVVIPDDVILIPEGYHREDRWRKYVDEYMLSIGKSAPKWNVHDKQKYTVIRPTPSAALSKATDLCAPNHVIVDSTRTDTSSMWVKKISGSRRVEKRIQYVYHISCVDK